MWKYILALLRLCAETVAFVVVWAAFQLYVSIWIVDPNTLWWLNTYGMGIIVLFVLWRGYRLALRVNAKPISAFHCRECGYDLRGATQSVFPECGSKFEAPDKEIGRPPPALS